MKKKFLLSVLCIGLALLSGCGNGKSNIRFGAAGIGGMYYSFASTFAGIVAGSDSGYTIEVKNTAGSEANLRLLSENYIQLAIAQNDLIYDALQMSRPSPAIPPSQAYIRRPASS